MFKGRKIFFLAHNMIYVLILDYEMDRILRGIMRYRNTTRASMVKEFEQVRDNPTPKAV